MRQLLAVLLLAFAVPAIAQVYGVLDLSHYGEAKATARPMMSGISMELGVGYRFNRFLAAEGSYLDSHGRSDAMVQGGTSTTHRWATSGLGVSALATIPAGPVSFLGRIGAHKLKTHFRALVVDTSTSPFTLLSEDTVSESGWTSNIGIGAQIYFHERLAMRAMLEQRNGKEFEIRSFSIGMLASF